MFCPAHFFIFITLNALMNKQRRNKLRDISDRLGSIMEEIEMVKDEEQDAYDNLPDGIRESDKGDQLADNVGELEDVINTLDSDVIDKIETIAAC